ncbi:MAG: hybrid-cluster NAD(P)-dependent oxidoreductase [Mycobacterium sp.]
MAYPTAVRNPAAGGFDTLPPPWAPECWGDDEDTVLVCRRVLDITHDVKSFHFHPDGDRTFRFDPGQFITLQLDINGERFTRCYTISSPPTRPHLLSITVKRVLGGPVSNWLHDNVTAGSRIRAQAPLGSFTLDHTAPKYLFLSAGSGITPVMSMTRTLFDLGSETDVLFVHSARSPADIIFRRELLAISEVMPNIRVHHVCEGDYPSERWTGFRGRLSAPMVHALVPDLNERQTYTCGPPAYMSSVRKILLELSYDMRNYHEESFSFEALPASDQPAPGTGPADEADQPAGGTKATTHRITFERSGITVDCDADQSILDAASAAGLRLPATCTEGMCGTCKTTLLAGEVDMQHKGGIRPREITQNKILPCCSRPRSDLRIDG